MMPTYKHNMYIDRPRYRLQACIICSQRANYDCIYAATVVQLMGLIYVIPWAISNPLNWNTHYYSTKLALCFKECEWIAAK